MSPVGEEDRMEERLCDEAGEGVLRFCGPFTRPPKNTATAVGTQNSDAHAELEAQIIAEGLSV